MNVATIIPCTYLDNTSTPCPRSRRISNRKNSGYCSFHELAHSTFATLMRGSMEESGLPYHKGMALKLVRSHPRVRAVAVSSLDEKRSPTQVGKEMAVVWAYEAAMKLPPMPSRASRTPLPMMIPTQSISQADATALLELAAEYEQQMNELRELIISLQQRVEALEGVRTMSEQEAIPTYVDQATAREEEDIYTSYLERTR